MPSGKQVLLNVLQEYSQNLQCEQDLDEVSMTLKSALCVHCSTSSETTKQINELAWLSQSEEGALVKQGIGLAKPNVFLSELFETLIEDSNIPKSVTERFPTLTKDQYSTGLDMIWHLLSSMQYWSELSSVENGGILKTEERDKILSGYRKYLEGFKHND